MKEDCNNQNFKNPSIQPIFIAIFSPRVLRQTFYLQILMLLMRSSFKFEKLKQVKSLQGITYGLTKILNMSTGFGVIIFDGISLFRT